MFGASFFWGGWGFGISPAGSQPLCSQAHVTQLYHSREWSCRYPKSSSPALSVKPQGRPLLWQGPDGSKFAVGQRPGNMLCLTNWKPQTLLSSLRLRAIIWSTAAHLPSACLYVASLSNRLEIWNWGVCAIILSPVCTTLPIQRAGQWGDGLLPCLSCAESFVNTFGVTVACCL